MTPLHGLLQKLYPNQHRELFNQITELINQEQMASDSHPLSEDDVIMITYGDSLIAPQQKPLQTLKDFMETRVQSVISNIHILPMFPYSSDDGFSVIDYSTIDPALGTWQDIDRLSEQFGLMFDAVINHISAKSPWFQSFLAGDPKYKDYFIECDPALDYRSVVRPRALPLYYEYKAHDGVKTIWATFSKDQVDLNYQSPEVLLEVLKVLALYVHHGARFIRLDAVGFLWKKVGTSSIHLPETHMLVQIIRQVLTAIQPDVKIITETNVPHEENISYFGNGSNEAHMVYQFPLPPLVLHTFIREDARPLLAWADSLKAPNLEGSSTYFNFLASHDGIGMRPVEDILNEEDREAMIQHVLNHGGQISYKTNSDGSQSAYELNINYLDALCDPADSLEIRVKKGLAAHALLLAFKGVPGIYVHSLLGSTSDFDGMKKSGIPRRINREKLKVSEVKKALDDPHSFRAQMFSGLKKLLKIRKNHPAFSPYAKQTIHHYDSRIVAFTRAMPEDAAILVCINVASVPVTMDAPFKTGLDLVGGTSLTDQIVLAPYQYRWIKILT